MNEGCVIAVKMICAGWKVRELISTGEIEWRSPRGISSSMWKSQSLDEPPRDSVIDAIEHDDIVHEKW
jgi:hypothetical protein